MSTTEKLLVALVIGVVFVGGYLLYSDRGGREVETVAAPAEAAPELTPLERLAARAADFSPVDAAQDYVVENGLAHVGMALIGLATILILTSEHPWLAWVFPGAARVRARGERLRQRAEEGDMPSWEERESQARNETLIACARIITAGIVLGLTLAG